MSYVIIIFDPFNSILYTQFTVQFFDQFIPFCFSSRIVNRLSFPVVSEKFRGVGQDHCDNEIRVWRRNFVTQVRFWYRRLLRWTVSIVVWCRWCWGQRIQQTVKHILLRRHGSLWVSKHENAQYEWVTGNCTSYHPINNSFDTKKRPTILNVPRDNNFEEESKGKYWTEETTRKKASSCIQYKVWRL